MKLINKDRRGVILKDNEINMLLILFKQKLLTSKQLQRILEIENGNPYRNFIRRLGKFCKYNLLVKQERAFGKNGFRFYYYRLGTEGAKMLLDLKLITKSEYEQLITRPATVDLRGLEHYLATQEIALHGILNTTVEQVESINPFSEPFLEEGKDEFLIIPDWILRINGNHYIHIEMDTGAETLNVLQDKLVRYKKLAQQMSTFKHSIIYVSLDDSFNTRFFYGDKVRRTGNMKQQLLKEKTDHIPNIDVYVVPMRRTEELMKNIIKHNGNIFHAEKHRMNCEFAAKLISEFNEVFSYTFHPIEDEEVYYTSEQINNKYRADKLYELRREGNIVIENVAFVLMNEGYLFSLDRLDYLSNLFKLQNTKKPIDRIIAVYKDSIEMEEDTWGELYKNVWIGETSTWASNISKNPKFYRQSTPYKKEVTYYNE